MSRLKRRGRTRCDAEQLRDPENLHHFVAEVVDDFDGDSPVGWFLEGAGGVAVEAFPGFFVDLGF